MQAFFTECTTSLWATPGPKKLFRFPSGTPSHLSHDLKAGKIVKKIGLHVLQASSSTNVIRKFETIYNDEHALEPATIHKKSVKIKRDTVFCSYNLL